MTERKEPTFIRSNLHFPSLCEARTILDGKLPSVFEKYDFPSQGIISTKSGMRVPVYVASGLGFNFAGKFFLEHYVHPNLEKQGAFILDPFKMCGEMLDPNLFNENQAVLEVKKGWERFNSEVINTVNYGLAIPRAGLIFAICEGHTTDEGMAAEMAYAAANSIPVVAVRSDFRLAENIAAGTNPAVSIFASDKYGGSYHENSIDDQAYQSAFAAVGEIITQRLKKAGYCDDLIHLLSLLH